MNNLIEKEMIEHGFSPLGKDKSSSAATIEAIDSRDLESLSAVGVNLSDAAPAGRYLLYGSNSFTFAPEIDGVEILPISEALRIYPDIAEKYRFKAVDKDYDDITRAVAEASPQGFFIRVTEGVQVTQPIQAGLFMHSEKTSMGLHNIVVLEEGAKLHLITGCTSGCNLSAGLHIAVSENFIGKNAELVNTMIHNWGPEFIVHPRGGTIVEEGGTYVSNYYSVKPPRHVDMNPFTHLKGRDSTAKHMTVIVCMPETYSELGGTILMEGENSGSEIVSRTVNHGGTVVQTGLLIGAAKDSRAHVDCSGLMLSDEGCIEAVPGLRSMHPDAKMSHEAAIGRIDMGEVNYLQSKGLDEMQAVALIVRGFLDIGIEVEGISSELERTIKEISELSGHGE